MDLCLQLHLYLGDAVGDMIGPGSYLYEYMAAFTNSCAGASMLSVFPSLSMFLLHVIVSLILGSLTKTMCFVCVSYPPTNHHFQRDR